MTNRGVVSCNGNFRNDVNSLFCKLDYKNGISYAKVKVFGYEEEFYTIYKNGTFAQVEHPSDGTMRYESTTRYDENTAKSKVEEAFMIFAFEDSIMIPRYTYVLEDDNYDVDGSTCYKINCLLADTTEKTLFITKDGNLIIEIIDFEDGDFIDYKYIYDTNEIEIPNEIEEFLNKE